MINTVYVYEQMIQNDRNIDTLRSLLERTNVSAEELDGGISLVNNILLNAAKKCNFVKRQKTQKIHPVENSQDWFTKECKIRRNIMRLHGKDISKNPFDKMKRKKFLEARATYKKPCRKSEKSYRQNLTHKLMEIGLNNPKTFWNIIKKMNNW